MLEGVTTCIHVPEGQRLRKEGPLALRSWPQAKRESHNRQKTGTWEPRRCSGTAATRGTEGCRDPGTDGPGRSPTAPGAASGKGSPEPELGGAPEGTAGWGPGRGHALCRAGPHRLAANGPSRLTGDQPPGGARHLPGRLQASLQGISHHPPHWGASKPLPLPPLVPRKEPPGTWPLAAAAVWLSACCV